MALDIMAKLNAAKAGNTTLPTQAPSVEQAVAQVAQATQPEAPAAQAPVTVAPINYTVGAKYMLSGVPAEFCGVHTDGRLIFLKDGNSKRTLIAAPAEALEPCITTVEAEVVEEEFEEEAENTFAPTQALTIQPNNTPATQETGLTLANENVLDDIRAVLAQAAPDLMADLEETLEDRGLNMSVKFTEIQMLREVEGFVIKWEDKKHQNISSFDGYILEHNEARSKFPHGSKANDGSKPECWSYDGKKPFGGEFFCDNCHACRFNQWGTHWEGGNRKACSERKVLYVLIPALEAGKPFKVSLASTQLAGVNTFMEAVRQSGKPFPLVTLHFEAVANTKGDNLYNDIDLTPIGMANPKELVHILKVRQQYKTAMVPGDAPVRPEQLPYTSQEPTLPVDNGEVPSLDL